MLRREVMKMGAGLFGLGAGTPSRFPYPGRPQPSPAVGPSSASVVRVNKVIVSGPGGGVFVYSGTPALGNPPIASVTSATTDPFGNPVKPDITAYGTGGSTSFVQLLPGNPASVIAATGDVAESVPGSIYTKTVGAGTTRQLVTQAVAPVVTGEPAGATGNLRLSSYSPDLTQVPGASIGASDGTNSASVTVEPTSVLVSGATTFLNAITGEVTLTPVVISGHPVIEQTDQTVITVTATSNTAITNAWPVGGGDAQIGTVYRLKAGGYGDQGSTAETLKVQLSFMGVNVGSDILPSSVIPISTQFLWTFEGTVSVISNGPTGKARASGEFKIWELNGPNSAVMIIGQHAAVPPAADSTVNTTTAQTMSLGASWGSTTGAPTITGAWSTLARAGA